MSGLSLLCRVYQDREHVPCSGTTDDGTNGPCACLCHQAELVNRIRGWVIALTDPEVVEMDWDALPEPVARLLAEVLVDMTTAVFTWTMRLSLDEPPVGP